LETPFGAYSFLMLLIRFYEGVRLTHQTSESGPTANFCADAITVRLSEE
jgi:hypothetical protein